MENEVNTTRIINTIDFRGLTPLQKALKLIEEYHISQRQAAKACKVGRRAVQCALNTHKRGRPVGVRGRPKIFKLAEENEVISRIDEAEVNQKPLTFKSFQDLVSNQITTLSLLQIT
jgi:hypothetical protein